jgi:hypothetical protein
METHKIGICWYVTHQDAVYGPVPFEDLKFEASRGRLKPNFDRVWKAGLKDWVLAGDVDGLFEKKEENPTDNEIEIEELVDEYFERKDWGGIGRAIFFLLSLALPLLMGFGLLFARDKVEEGLMPTLLIVSGAVAAVVFIFSIFKRLRNLAMSYWWVLGLFVPLVNLWLGYRLFACPEGYAHDKDLDDAGWLVTWVYWFPVAALMGLGVFAVLRGPESVGRLFDNRLWEAFSF